jgi:uncharacterized protein involved in exopolysaccharide biosynthesis
MTLTTSEARPAPAPLTYDPDRGSIRSPRDASLLAAVVPSSLPEVLAFAARHRTLLFASTAVMAAAMLTTALVKPRTYSAGTSFILAGGRQEAARIGTLAAQFGLSVGAGADPARSPDFYADLLTSRAVLQDVVTAPMKRAGRETTLLSHYGIEAPTRAEAVRQASEELRKSLTVRMESQTGVVSVGVSATDPELAESVLQRLLERLNQFNLQVRRSQASTERRFVAEQYDIALGELQTAERRLQEFLLRNRAYANSPELLFQHDRLQRTVSLRQRVVESHLESLERAKVDEVRNTPVIAIIDPPLASRLPDPRGGATRFVLGAVLGALVGGLIALALDLRSVLRAGAARGVRERLG